MGKWRGVLGEARGVDVAVRCSVAEAVKDKGSALQFPRDMGAAAAETSKELEKNFRCFRLSRALLAANDDALRIALLQQLALDV